MRLKRCNPRVWWVKGRQCQVPHCTNAEHDHTGICLGHYMKSPSHLRAAWSRARRDEDVDGVEAAQLKIIDWYKERDAKTNG